MVASELEHSLAFPPGQAAWDFVARSTKAAENGNNVFVVACPRDRLEAMLGSDLSPTVVDAEPYAYQRVLALASITDALVVDFGATHTTFCQIRGGHLDNVRVALRGGDDLDRVIAHRRNITVQNARRLKHDNGLQLEEMREFLDQVLSAALLANEPGGAPIYVTGGGARCKGLPDWLSKRLGRQVLPVPAPDRVDPYQEVVALGMALWGSRGGDGIDLATVKRPQSRLAPIAVLVALILMLVSVDLVAREVSLRLALRHDQDAFQTVVRTALPKSNLRTLPEFESVVESRRQGARGSGRNIEAVVMVISQALREAETNARSTDIRVTEMSVTGTELRLRGEAGAYPVIDALKTAMARRFEDANVNSTQIAARKGFEMVMPLTGGGWAAPISAAQQSPSGAAP